MLSLEKATRRHADAILRIDAMVLGNTSRSTPLRESIETSQCHVARLDEEVTGFAVMNQNFFQQSLVALLMVHPRHQRKGVGEALLRYLESICPTEKLFISTNQSNRRMQQLCRKLGFTPSGIIDNLDPGDPELIYCKKPQHSS